MRINYSYNFFIGPGPNHVMRPKYNSSKIFLSAMIKKRSMQQLDESFYLLFNMNGN